MPSLASRVHVKVDQLSPQPMPWTGLYRFARHPLARVVYALLFLMPVIQLNNAFSFLVLDPLDEPLLSAIQFPKAILLVWLLLVPYRFYCRRVEGREAFEVGGAGWWREFAGGAATGAGMVLLIVGILALTGSYGIAALNPPFVLLSRIFRYGQGSFVEELVITVVLFRLVEEYGGTKAALLAVSLLFGLLHLGNDHATMATSACLAIQEITSLAPFVLTRRIWMPWALHFAWNYCQTAVFGMNNSGMAHAGFISPVVSGPAWLTGASFGIEGSWLSLVSSLAVGIPLLVLARRRGQFVAPRRRRTQVCGS